MNEQDDRFRERREQILLRLLFRITRLMTVETVSLMQKRGITGMMPAYPRLLGNLDTEGTRIGALARKMGTTRQAVAQLAKEVEAAGFVQRLPDPEDGRGVVVRFTERGRLALDCAIEVMTSIEGQYAEITGAREMAQMKSSLALILGALDQQGKFGID